MAPRSNHGFSLLEVLVALAVLAIALMSLTALRTESIVNSAEARNLRVARTLAYRFLTEIQAGMRNAYDMRGVDQEIEGFPHFKWRLLIGETEIQEEETRIAEFAADKGEREARLYERQEWLNERKQSRDARAAGVPIGELRETELEVDDTPDEETVEEIAIYVYYPSMRSDDEPRSFRLRSQTSTLALSGLTGEQAADKGSNLRPSGSEENTNKD